MERSKEIKVWAADYIKGTLPDFEGQAVYGCDLASALTEMPNNNGKYEEDSWGFIASHINDARDEYEYEKDCFGQVLHNPFDAPDAFVVCMLINTCEGLLADCPTVQANWDVSLELTPGIIQGILSEIFNLLWPEKANKINDL